MQTLHDIAELRRALAAARAADRGLVCLVPTMGNLHEGHIALVEAARKLGGTVVASVFVNPLQFGEGEDYDSYPRTLDQDARRLAAAGVDVLYAPGSRTMYPLGPGVATVRVEGVTEGLCGARRPGHFAGVTTVVAMLFNQVQPDIAVFGEKDYQQLVVIRRLVAALHWPVEIVGVPTLREPDGLAMSSRNQYLTTGERELAPALHAALCEGADRIAAGDTDVPAIEADIAGRLQARGLVPDYVEIRNGDLSRPARASADPAAGQRVLAAVHLGRARLIDNVAVAPRG